MPLLVLLSSLLDFTRRCIRRLPLLLQQQQQLLLLLLLLLL